MIPTTTTKPIASPSTTAALSAFYVLLYVLPFYLSPKTRPSPTLSRDAPPVIRARIRAVSLSCLLTCIFTSHIGNLTLAQSARLFGWWPIDIADISKSLALVCILFAGPLFENGIVEGNWRLWIRGAGLRETLDSSIGWRNYVAGPLTEEHVFRSMLLSLHLFSAARRRTLVFCTPLYFGIAHLHHAYEFRLTHPGIPLLPVVFRTLFQFAYTSVFGFYAAFLYLRTGSLWAVVLTHSFCNWMGFPRVWGRLEGSTVLMDGGLRGGIVGPDGVGEGGSGGEAPGKRLSVAWTFAYYVLLVAGAYGFYANLWWLTESELALVDFG